MSNSDALDLAFQFSKLWKRSDIDSQAFSIEIYDGRLKMPEVFYFDVDIES